MSVDYWVKNLRLEFSKFTLVGGVNFVFTFILFYLCVRILKINYLVAIVLVSLLGMVLTYCLNHSWVFKPEDKLDFKSRFLKYLFSGFLSIGLNVLALHYVVSKTGFDPFYVQIALIPLIVVFNFSTAKFWSLRRKTE
ncbi:GtrA family protein [Pseudomonas sp. G(2018)]|uniref:GtrA family protein n=1 Tax=Pseudomonas sp. G(2018) TaxID=2502242 RepID=UPI0010F5851F